jgi:hypothetical protein
MNTLAKTTIFLAGVALGAAVIGHGAGAVPPTAKLRPPSCAPGFTASGEYGPTPASPNYGWTCTSSIIRRCNPEPPNVGGPPDNPTYSWINRLGDGSFQMNYSCVYAKPLH